MPATKGPAARPNRFWNSASTDEPVARTPGWTTSITMAVTGPTVQVAMKPPNAISANCAGAGSVVPKAVTSTTIEATQSSAMVTSLRRGCRVPTRSTRAPQITDPAAPHNTTIAALRPACAGTTPCTRFRKLGSHDQRADTTTSCAAPPTHTHSMVRERASTLTM